MVPAHFLDVDVKLSDHSDLVTSCFTHILIGITCSLLLFRAGLFSSSDTFTVCSGVVVKVWKMSKNLSDPQNYHKIYLLR